MITVVCQVYQTGHITALCDHKILGAPLVENPKFCREINQTIVNFEQTSKLLPMISHKRAKIAPESCQEQEDRV